MSSLSTGRAYLGTPGEVDPLGAAVVAAGVSTAVYWASRELPAVVDAWVACHGLVFAAEAGALLGSVNVSDPTTTQLYKPFSNVAVRHVQPAEFPLYWAQPVLVRLRALLAAAEDAEYDQVVARLAGHRSAGDGVRVVTSYLLPTEQAWVDEDVAMLRAAGAKAPVLGRLLASATTTAQAQVIFDASDAWWIAHQPALTYSLGAYVGPGAASILARVFDRDVCADSSKRMVSMLGQVPTDEAFQLLLERLDKKYVQAVVLKAMERFPRRAMRLLPAAATGAGAKATTAKDLLRDHALSHPGLVPAELLEQVEATRPTAPVASADQLPDILVTPPWATRKARPKPVVLAGLGSPTPSTLRWTRGEQASWATSGDSGEWWVRPGRGWPELVKEALTGHSLFQLAVLATAPVELVRPQIRAISPAPTWRAGFYLRRLLGRLGEDAVGYVVLAAQAQPTSAAGALLPIEGSEVALRMAEWYARSKSVRPVAVCWFDRHPETAARDLVPPALGKPGKERVAAEAALRLLDQHGHRDTVRAAAAAHGSQALAAIDAALAVDPLDMLPARMPSLPGWLDPAHLPPVLLRGHDAALPASAIGHLCTMLAISKPGDTYAGVEIVRPALDAASLAEMAWAVFERWAGAGYPSGDGWVLEALGLRGDDETVRRLAPLIRAWPGQSAHTRAVAGLEVLSTIGSDVALMHLHGIAQKAKFKGLKTKAQEKMDEVADTLGLTADQLADRLVPDLGLEPDGSLLLDYGPRRFRVGFDEQLEPVVADEDGARRGVLPKPNAKDDPSKAPAAYALFTALKKDVKTIATDQIRRFEQAMVTGRRWTATEHRTLFVEHPLLWHLVRRLVWAVFDDQGTPVGSFRVAEDRTLADCSDDELALNADATVGIAHPLHLAGSLKRWSDLFADYEILQPFPQLGREVFLLSDGEPSLDRFVGLKVPTGKILGLSHRGWERGTPQDAGIQITTQKPLPGGRSVAISLDPGIIVGNALEWAEQTIAGVGVAQGSPETYGQVIGLAALDAITASEALRDLESLRS